MISFTDQPYLSLPTGFAVHRFPGFAHRPPRRDTVDTDLRTGHDPTLNNNRLISHRPQAERQRDAMKAVIHDIGDVHNDRFRGDLQTRLACLRMFNADPIVYV